MLASIATPECLEDQIAIVQNVFNVMVEMEMYPVQSPAPLERAVASVLFFEQASHGLILIECSEKLAFAFTSRLMSIDVPISVDADVADSMGELANMIGGNLKGLMPAETQISMPALVGYQELPALLGSRAMLTRLCFANEDGVCRISLFDAA